MAVTWVSLRHCIEASKAYLKFVLEHICQSIRCHFLFCCGCFCDWAHYIMLNSPNSIKLVRPMTGHGYLCGYGYAMPMVMHL